MAASSRKMVETLNPELLAGGFSRRDGTREFYSRINALVRPDMTILDFGAGRGAAHEKSGPNTALLNFRGRVAKVVGCDVDTAIHENPALDEAQVLEIGKPLPFPDASFDLIFADWVIEHIEDPPSFVAEIDRVLKPGGWFCARTPSKFGYVAVIARLTPESAQGGVLKRVQPERQEKDVFPKFYRLNTLGALRKAFPPERFLDASYTYSPDPAYHANRAWLYRLVDMYQSLPISAMRTTVHVFMQKNGGH